MTDSRSENETEPPAEVSEIEARARRYLTACGDGVMVWRSWGEGEPLVLAHGAQGSWMHWIRNIDTLSQQRQLLVPDLPGHADSALPVTSDHTGISAVLARGLREILGKRLPVDMVGFSLGGVVLANLAAQHDGIARRVILVGCGGLDTPLGAIDVGRVSGLSGEQRRQALKRNLLGLMLHSANSVDEFALWQLPYNASRARVNSVKLVLPDKLKRVLPELEIPVDAIWGEFDRPHPDPQLQKNVLLVTHPDTDFRVIADAGHWAMFEQPDAFNRTLLDMLSDNVSDPQ